jgi:hypothetical protein
LWFRVVPRSKGEEPLNQPPARRELAAHVPDLHLQKPPYMTRNCSFDQSSIARAPFSRVKRIKARAMIWKKSKVPRVLHAAQVALITDVRRRGVLSWSQRPSRKLLEIFQCISLLQTCLA